jgi:hypothetical protein
MRKKYEDDAVRQAKRRETWRLATAKRRAALKAAGVPLPPGGGKATNAERQRRWRERHRKKKEQGGEE